ncbi:MAG TPA: UDP-N-acetylglucosamine--N-acetylmuramyl-(pentapeptide) pyrophosphoryl-undecaprenol N-acetylglucosamine transferase, partial [Armatimonadota bacterium]|nr:UDP-N-acetylglucosamine--N-acetylmuramyl-(pentapeptide) pyrophosphoryl-undecaprenol N-acetylglucosamine transferase [Armatimonadota bacterium]
CIAVSEALARRDPSTEFLFVGANRENDRRLFEGLSLPHVLVDARPFPYRPSVAMAKALLALPKARSHAREFIADFGPHVIFSTGGYVAAPVIPVAKKMGIPVILHAADAMPGRANRMLARYASTVTLAYEESRGRFARHEVAVVGQPVRRQFREASPERGREALGIPLDATVILAFGAAQGADSINRAVRDALRDLLTVPHLHIVLLTGAAHVERYENAAADIEPAEGAGFHCLSFISDFGDVMAASDLIISRCGSSSLAEILAVGAPLIAVPYPHAGGHQRHNTTPLADAGAALVVEDEHLSGATLGGTVVELLGDPGRMTAMAAASAKLGQADAAEAVAELICQHFPHD